jgi:hypothetical protein
VKLRLVFSLVATALLAACASRASTYNPGTTAPTGDGSLDRPAAKGPTYAISLALPEARSSGDLRNHAAAAVGSLRAITNVKKHKYVFVVNNSAGCGLGLSGTTASGCGVVPTSSTTYVTRKATFDFYSKPGGKGCLLATAQYKGNVAYRYPLPLTFKAENTKKCWK